MDIKNQNFDINIKILIIIDFKNQILILKPQMDIKNQNFDKCWPNKNWIKIWTLKLNFDVKNQKFRQKVNLPNKKLP